MKYKKITGPAYYYYGEVHPIGEPIREYKRKWLAMTVAALDVSDAEKRGDFKNIGLDFDRFVNDGIIERKLPETATDESLN